MNFCIFLYKCRLYHSTTKVVHRFDLKRLYIVITYYLYH
nr:MAG TPA: hypothetical protein [Herelleviridae sp.]